MDLWIYNQTQIHGSTLPEHSEHGPGEYGIDSNAEVGDRVHTFEENAEWTMNSLKQSGTEGAHEQRFPGDWKSSVQGVKVSQPTIRFIQVGMGKCEVEECPNPERTMKSCRRGRPILVEGIWRRVCAAHYV